MRNSLRIGLLLGLLAPPTVAARQLADTVPVPPSVRAAYQTGTRDVSGVPGERYWQIWPQYELVGWLDPDSATVRGRGTLSFTNSSPNPMSEIVLRLDQNRFRPELSRDHVTRGIEIRSLALNGRAVALTSSRVTGLQTTVARIGLDSLLQPGSRLVVSYSWDYEVPAADDRAALRQGHLDNRVFQMAQWYPRLAMYDDLEGWDVTEHDGSREFFNPFGSFSVALGVPSGWLVGASGTLENPEDVLGSDEMDRLVAAAGMDTTLVVVETGGRGEQNIDLTAPPDVWRFRADSVSDFAWGASPDFSWTVTARTMSTGRLMIHALATPGREHVLIEASRAAADVITVLSDQVMPYAWSSHTLLDGPEGAMEYPSLTMSHGRAIRHELAHQWFPMMVGTDETRFDFLDEGFATFYVAVSAGSRLGAPMAERPAFEPLLHPTDIRTPRSVIGYGRGSRMLHALADLVGENRLLAALRMYASSWRFKHPSPWDFMASIETVLGQTLDEFWLRWLFSADEIDHGL